MSQEPSPTSSVDTRTPRALSSNIWLFITKDGSKRWVFAYERTKKRREMALGAASDVGLGKARDLAEAARELLAQGIDPIEARRAAEAEAEEAAARQTRAGSTSA